MESLLQGQLVGYDEQKSWNDGDALGERVEGREDKEEEAGRGDIPLWAQGSYAALSLLSPYHPLLKTALPTAR